MTGDASGLAELTGSIVRGAPTPGRHGLALIGDKTVRAWGDDSDHQVIGASSVDQAIAVATGDDFSRALRVGLTLTTF